MRESDLGRDKERENESFWLISSSCAVSVAGEVESERVVVRERLGRGGRVKEREAGGEREGKSERDSARARARCVPPPSFCFPRNISQSPFSGVLRISLYRIIEDE